MTMSVKTLLAPMIVAGALVPALALAGDNAKTVKYEGDLSARAVCLSIVYDDVDGLEDAFRHGRSYPLEREHLAYECNSMALDEFAFTQNAVEVSDYLAPKFGNRGRVTIEQVGSIED
ncbi:hypothetical protein EY643_08725 [Halioglobus maricola]|uniref:DUF3718 domain-containing protein n=1 Tax=Halioglobus maricola TaxID=2601894 RepID=A0A5P9NJM4_9GAMM|nr:hypothetical protein [Halioglobus maricola]QFU75735.1 hypothetical protein EY643_08725 [Halioglobus maricola]